MEQIAPYRSYVAPIWSNMLLQIGATDCSDMEQLLHIGALQIGAGIAPISSDRSYSVSGQI